MRTAGQQSAGSQLGQKVNLMQFLTHRRPVSGTVALLYLIMYLFWGAPGAALAQGIDADPPSIEPAILVEGLRGDNQVFSATVTDNDVVSSVTLHYRLGDNGPYQRVPMDMLGSTGIYTVSIDSTEIPDTTETIHYYFEALDAAENRTLHGFAFDPLQRALVDVPTVAAQPAVAETASSGMSLQQKFIYGALGVLLIGVIASAGGGGGGSDAGVPVTIVGGELP